MTINVSARTLVPSTLNLGSGKDYRNDCFNIDIDDSWYPDAIVDFGGLDLGPDGISVSTQRFGDVQVRPAFFDRIIANDVLEHVPDLMRLMTNCLALLKEGGVFEVSVPYDLSCGAWQDPTHVRAFNERSWLYYTDWFWYMGWSEARFTLDRLQFVPSDIGRGMAETLPLGELIRVPRAIDSMSVSLRKIPLTPADRQTWDYWRERKRLAERERGPMAADAPPTIDLVTDLPAPSTAAAPAVPAAFAGGWAEHGDRHCVWIVTPEGYTHSRAFDDCATALSEAFADLGGSAPLVRDPHDWQGRAPIVIGPHLLPPQADLPPGSILVNFEQVSTGEGWIGEAYLSLLRRFPVLDYSQRNQAALIGKGISHAGLIGIGHSPSLLRIAPAPVKDIDVLFYGSINPRRKRIIDGLQARGLEVVSLFDVYGAERDASIARAKVVLNLHFYDSAIFEVVRVSYLLANGICVLSEGDEGDPDVAPFRGGLAICSYADLVERCAALVTDEATRTTVANVGQERMMARRQADLLREAMGR